MKKSIINAIDSIATMDELNDVIRLVKIKQKALRAQAVASAKMNIRVGDTVKVDSRNGTEFGEVLEIKRTKAIVLIDDTRWNCPLSILEVA